MNGGFAVSFTDAGGNPKRVQLSDGETLIGRAPACHIVINVGSVSRQHARLRVKGDRCTLADAGSSYGTQVNGSPLAGEIPLAAGDTFQCGAVEFTLEQSAPDPHLLTDDHELLQDAASIMMRIEDAGIDAGKTASAKGAPTTATAQQFLRLLGEISRTLVDVLPLPQVLSRVVDLVFEVIPAERTFLLLRDTPDAAVTARVVRARDGSTPDATLSRTIVTKVMRERVAMLAHDARSDSRLDGAGSLQAMVQVRSFMCAPLWNRNEVIGVLYTDNPKSKRFNAEDLDVFVALANYAAVAIEQARVAEQLKKETQMRERLARYHSPAVVNRILGSNMSEYEAFEATERDVTVMFTDIVNFTGRSEHMSPTDVAKLLNTYFTQMAEHIFQFDGTLDKFIGDAILAIFGAPLQQDDHADRAIGCALAMRRALAEMNKDLGGTPLQMRIALNSGVALTGDIGSPRRREFTVLGDVVNACSRIESAVCKPGQIVCSRATLDRTTRTFDTRSLGRISLRGRESEVELFEVN